MKALLASKWASRKLAITIAGILGVVFGPLAARYLGAEIPADIWLGVAGLVVVALGGTYNIGVSGVDKQTVAGDAQLKALAIQAKAAKDGKTADAEAKRVDAQIAIVRAIENAKNQPERDRLSAALQGLV